jgi:hypothetical protein
VVVAIFLAPFSVGDPEALAIAPSGGLPSPHVSRSLLCAFGLVSETAPGENDQDHGEHQDHNRRDHGRQAFGEQQEFGRYLLPIGHVEGAVEEPHDEHTAPTAVVEPHDEYSYEHSEHCQNTYLNYNRRELAERGRFFVDKAGGEESGHVDQREEWRDYDAGQYGPAPLLQGVLHEPRPSELFP